MPSSAVWTHQRCVLAFLVALCLTHTAAGQQPLARFVPLRRVEADPRKEYPLKQENGPWMIYAASFAGPEAENEAHQLVIELRQKYKVPAYIHHQAYDFTETVEGRGLDRYGEPRKMRYQNPARFDEVAVLVGNFPSVDAPAMAKLLEELKYANPNTLDPNDRNTGLRFAGFRAFQKSINPNKAKSSKGPMGQAFVTRNPMLPESYFAQSGVDNFVAQMNRGVKHSLLECPGKYTVRVATFRGASELDQGKVKQLLRSGRMESRLAEAAEKAHFLVTQLRKRNIEAYEFHDRTESLVTVGSFDSVGTPRTDGKTEINPAILKIMKCYGAQEQTLPGGRVGLAPRAVGGIPFDVQPMPVEVPRRSIGADYARTSYR